MNFSWLIWLFLFRCLHSERPKVQWCCRLIWWVEELISMISIGSFTSIFLRRAGEISFLPVSLINFLLSWFVHRCGRAGRNGREGSSVLIATPGQAAYVNFIKQHEKVCWKREVGWMISITDGNERDEVEDSDRTESRAIERESSWIGIEE